MLLKTKPSSNDSYVCSIISSDLHFYCKQPIYHAKRLQASWFHIWETCDGTNLDEGGPLVAKHGLTVNSKQSREILVPHQSGIRKHISHSVNLSNHHSWTTNKTSRLDALTRTGMCLCTFTPVTHLNAIKEIRTVDGCWLPGCNTLSPTPNRPMRTYHLVPIHTRAI